MLIWHIPVLRSSLLSPLSSPLVCCWFIWGFVSIETSGDPSQLDITRAFITLQSPLKKNCNTMTCFHEGCTVSPQVRLYIQDAYPKIQICYPKYCLCQQLLIILLHLLCGSPRNIRTKSHQLKPLLCLLGVSQEVDLIHQLGDGKPGSHMGVLFVHVVVELSKVFCPPCSSSSIARLGRIPIFEEE